MTTPQDLAAQIEALLQHDISDMSLQTSLKIAGLVRDNQSAIVAAIRQGEGMVLVPREPTEAMISASIDAVLEYKHDDDDRVPETLYECVYSAMLAAAPLATCNDSLQVPAPDERDDEVRNTCRTCRELSDVCRITHCSKPASDPGDEITRLRKALQDIAYEAGRSNGGLVHMKRAIAIASRIALSRAKGGEA